jgi:hypothetical protein
VRAGYLPGKCRATNAAFTDTLQTWPVQAWADGSIYAWDNFADLTNKPAQAFYRLRYDPSRITVRRL